MSDSTPAAQAAVAYFAAIGQAEVSELTALFAADVHLEDPVGTPVLRGHEGIARFLKGLSRAWAEIRMSPTLVCARGTSAAVAWHAVGRSATNTVIEFDGIDVVTVDDAGLITRIEGYWDLEAVIAQM